MTRALIADDEPHLAHYLRDQLHALWPALEVIGIARNGVEAAAAIAEHAPDLAFLDIQMPGLNDLEVAQGIEGPTRVVFVTAFDAYALAAFEHAALDYVLKPLATERLARTVARLQAQMQLQAPAPVPDAAMADALRRLMAQPPRPHLRYLRAGQGERTHHLDVAEVLFFQSDDKYTVVATARGEFLIRTPIAELLAQLDPAQFWQVHRATIVNLAWLDGTRRDDNSRLFLRIRGHAGELPVSRAFVHLFKAM
jgi:DNA-binding LytR/AlgR family response regulator